VKEEKKTDGAAAYVAFFQFPETFAVRTRLVHLPQRDVHEIIAVNQMPVEGLAVLQLNQHGSVLRRRQQRQRQLDTPSQQSHRRGAEKFTIVG
jgi:hypothetical protein